MLRKCIVLFFTTMILLSACHSPFYNQTEGNVADVKLKASDVRQHQDAAAKAQQALKINSGLYVDTTPISLERHPTWLRNHMVIRGDQLPFSYYSRTIANGANSSVLTKYQTGLDPSINVTMNYSGTVRGALDMLASKTGYVYSLKGSSIYWQAFVTKTFDIAFMPGGTDYLMGKTSGGSGASTSQTNQGSVANYVSSDSSDSEYSNLKGTLSIWKDLDTTIKQLLSPEGKVMVSESTTSVTVRDRPTNVELVNQYIHNLNTNLSKQVLVKVEVLDIRLEDAYNFGIDWQLVQKAFHNSAFKVNANYGTPLAIENLNTQVKNAFDVPQFGETIRPGTSADAVPSYTILLNALSQQGKTSVVSEPRVVCLNNQVSVIRIVRSEGYLASIQNTAMSGSSSSNIGTVTSQLTPGTVITGLTLYILPKILKDNIYLQVNADLSTNEGFRQFGENGTATTPSNIIELPQITEKHFNQRSMIRSGDTLILSGFRQVANRTGANQFLNYQTLGGKSAEQVNTETIVLITPIILHGSA